MLTWRAEGPWIPPWGQKAWAWVRRRRRCHQGPGPLSWRDPLASPCQTLPAYQQELTCIEYRSVTHHTITNGWQFLLIWTTILQYPKSVKVFYRDFWHHNIPNKMYFINWWGGGGGGNKKTYGTVTNWFQQSMPKY